MEKIKGFGDTREVQITVLVDNRADLLESSNDTIKRFTEKPLLAEHGYAVLVDLREAGIRILWDAGLTEIALPENMKRMGFDPGSIDKIALSHGHGDHTAGVSKILAAMDLEAPPRQWEAGTGVDELRQWAQGRKLKVIAHPAVFRERWSTPENGRRYGPIKPPPRREWEALGAQIVLSERPTQLGPGCWTTGAIPRLSFETAGIPKHLSYRQGDELFKDTLEDDQAIVIHVAGKGLVVLSGCAHSGIVNTVNYARQISGIHQIYAVIGGFHMARSSDEDIRATIKAFQAFNPAIVAPSHCTGLTAICRFAAEMPEAFVSAVVGTTYLF